MKNKFYVYAILDPRKPGIFQYKDTILTYEPFYVGKGSGNRISHHLCKSRLRVNTPKIQKIKKLLSLGMVPILVFLKKEMPELDAFETEKYFIKTIGRKDLGYGPLTNTNDGGFGSSGHVPSSETKLKISKSLIGKNVGRKLSDEWKAKISKNNARYWLGKKYSPERIKKMSEISKKQDFSWKYVTYKIISPDGKEFVVSNGLNNFCIKHGLSRSKMLSVSSGRSKHHKLWRCHKVSATM